MATSRCRLQIWAAQILALIRCILPAYHSPLLPISVRSNLAPAIRGHFLFGMRRTLFAQTGAFSMFIMMAFSILSFCLGLATQQEIRFHSQCQTASFRRSATRLYFL